MSAVRARHCPPRSPLSVAQRPEPDVGFTPGRVLSGEDRGLPINHLLFGSKITPEEMNRLNKAYTFALRSSGLVDRNDPLTELIARKVIEIGATGVSDPGMISELALKDLKM